MELKKTSLNEAHKKCGGKMVDFFSWELPVEYSGLTTEHISVRESAGLFDVSHMGEVMVTGKDALKVVDYLVTNDAKILEENQVMYTFMCNEMGGVVDDLLVYKYTDERVLLVINAANIDKDLRWIEEKSAGFSVEIENISSRISQIAIQGPKAQEILQKLTEVSLDEIEFFRFQEDVFIAGERCLVSRTGYTGEDGFEIYTENASAEKIWESILETGGDEILPAGLGARDTLRFEAGLPLYGNELGDDITPLEAGFGFFVKLDKGEFIGREVLAEQKASGVKRRIAGFKLNGKGIGRSGYKVLAGDKEIGHITTGYQIPGRSQCIGLALIDKEHSKLGAEIDVQVRKRVVKGEIISKKFLDKNYKK